MLDTSLNKVLLMGVVGSTAYGLAGPDSDVDRLGMYAAPTVQFHGLHPPVGKEASVVLTKPDVTMHEAGKFASLALGGNPTVLELLWLPEYETVSTFGIQAVEIRSSFLSAPRVRDAYLGYATQQFRRLVERADGSFNSDLRKRTAKHARHMMRLCHQGFILYAAGRLVIKMENPKAFHEFGERIAEGDVQAAQRLIVVYEEKFNDTTSALPDRPDESAVEKWLREVRAGHL